MPVITHLEDMLLAQLKARRAAGCAKTVEATGHCLVSIISGKMTRLVKGDPGPARSPAAAPDVAKD